MAYTHFPYGVSSFGVPMLPGPGVVPNPKAGTLPTTNGVAGYTGVQFVSGDFGSDANDGLTPSSPLLHLDTAYNRTLGGINEIIYVLGGSSAVTYSSSIASGGAGLNWSKNYTHCIGLNAGNMIGGRSRLTNGASTYLLTPLLQISGIGCHFENMEIENVGSDAALADVCLAVTGVRNAFINCQISGGVGATTATEAGMRSLIIGGTTAGTFTGPADECYFRHCYIGLDTLSRTAASSEIEIGGGTARTVFEDCMISTYGTGSNLYLTIGASGIDRFCIFRNCQFLNPDVLSGGTIMTDAFSLNGSPGGRVIFTGCLITGATATAATKTAEYGDNAYAAATTAKAINLSW